MSSTSIQPRHDPATGETLEVPLRERNDWLVAAGFAPLFRARPLDDPEMQQVMAAVQIAPLLWHRAHREAEALGGEEMQRVLDELRPYQDDDTLWAAEDAALVPVLPLVVEQQGLRLSLFTVIATFGTAQDVTADELRIESFFPADAATEAIFRQAAATPPAQS